MTRLRGSLSIHTPTSSAMRIPSSKGPAWRRRTAMVGSAIWVTAEPSSLMDCPASSLAKRGSLKSRAYTRRSCQLAETGPARAPVCEQHEQADDRRDHEQQRREACAVLTTSTPAT